ncbi:MAG: OsmC family protein [Chloroflexi bacterium]|nr:OsmC family protein [Chloroflexota bacterium]MCL5074749.1 OsmC family protein [Chloroflexota bacterium]
MTHEARVKLIEGMKFEGIATHSGHSLLMDAAPAVGGQNAGFRPMELLLVSLGGCTGMDVISILHRMRQEISGYELIVKGEQATEHPHRYTDITVEHVIRGKRVAEEAVKKAIELSNTKYCSSMATLGKSAHITTRYRIIEEPSEQSDEE